MLRVNTGIWGGGNARASNAPIHDFLEISGFRAILTVLFSKTFGVNVMRLIRTLALASSFTLTASVAFSEDKPLNFLMIWGDDVGYWNVSAYNQGMMG